MPADADDELTELLDEARAEERSGARRRERHLRQQAEEGATLAGMLLDLAEGQYGVVVQTVAGTSRRGRVVGLGADFVVVRDGAIDAHLALVGITTVRPHPGEHQPPASGARPPPLDLRLVELLSRLVGSRAEVALTTTSGEVLSGRLSAVGDDVVTLELDGDPPSRCYLRSTSLVEVLLRSG